MSVLRFVPIMWLPPLVYALVALATGSSAETALSSQAFAATLPSGDPLIVTWGALFLLLGLACLSTELIRNAQPIGGAITMNVMVGLSLVPCIILFLTTHGFATTEFLLTMVMMLLVFLMGVAVQVFTARRTLGFDPPQ